MGRGSPLAVDSAAAAPAGGSAAMSGGAAGHAEVEVRASWPRKCWTSASSAALSAASCAAMPVAWSSSLFSRTLSATSWKGRCDGCNYLGLLTKRHALLLEHAGTQARGSAQTKRRGPAAWPSPGTGTRLVASQGSTAPGPHPPTHPSSAPPALPPGWSAGSGCAAATAEPTHGCSAHGEGDAPRRRAGWGR
jgi:hypothetical protein